MLDPCAGPGSEPAGPMVLRRGYFADGTPGVTPGVAVVTEGPLDPGCTRDSMPDKPVAEDPWTRRGHDARARPQASAKHPAAAPIAPIPLARALAADGAPHEPAAGGSCRVGGDGQGLFPPGLGPDSAARAVNPGPRVRGRERAARLPLRPTSSTSRSSRTPSSPERGRAFRPRARRERS